MNSFHTYICHSHQIRKNKIRSHPNVSLGHVLGMFLNVGLLSHLRRPYKKECRPFHTSENIEKLIKFIVCLILVQPPSGFIHWTVAVIPLACVIAVLICVIAFLLWRLRQKPRKHNGDITVNAIHYDVQTRSILSQEGRANNLRAANQTRVHFQEPNNREDPKYHTLTQAKNNENSVQYAALYKKPGELPIPRRLAIRRKESSELTGKYPLNKSGHDKETEGEYERSCVDKESNQADGRDRLSHEYHVLVADYDEPGGIIESDQENIEKPDCSEDELSYLEIIP